MENTKSRGSAKTQSLQKRSTRQMTLQLLRIGIVIGMGILLPKVTVYGGLSPFGIAFMAVVQGPYALLAFLSTFFGYFLWGNVEILRYSAALIAVVGMRWATAAFPKVVRSLWFGTAISFLSTVVTGCALFLTAGDTVYEAILIVSEGILAGGFSYFCAVFVKRVLDGETVENSITTVASVMVMLAALLLALVPIEIAGISIGRVLTVLIILLFAHIGGLTGGCLSGSLFGLFSLISLEDPFVFVAIYTFGGFLAGLFSEKGRAALVLAFAAITGLVITTFQAVAEGAILIGLYEVILAGACLFCFPRSVYQTVHRYLYRSSSSVASNMHSTVAENMQSAADAMQKIAETVDQISHRMSKLGAPDIGSFYRESTTKVCEKCEKRFSCWDGNFSNVMDSFNHITKTLEKGDTVSAETFDGYLKENCEQLNVIGNVLNQGYREYLIRQNAFRRLQELRGVITDQFANIAQILREFSGRYTIVCNEDEETTKLIRRELKRDELQVQSLCCKTYDNDRMEIDLELKEILTPDEAKLLCDDIGHWCGRSLSLVAVEGIGEITNLHLAEGIRFCISLGVSQIQCKGEKLCGDVFELLQDPSGHFFVVLSDGMGCGGTAAVDGAITAGLAVRLLQAGFGYESILKLANTALMAKAGEETLSTLDIVAIDLYTGESEFLKAGAGLSLLLSHGYVSRIEDSSLPLGILRDITFARSKDRLVDGDILVVMSDGISNNGVSFVEELLKNFDTENGDVQKLAEDITKTAQRMCNDEKGDDMTAIVVKVDAVS